MTALGPKGFEKVTARGLPGPAGVMQARQQEESTPWRFQLTLNRSPETHKNLIARIPFVTGRDLPEWFASLESGPAFLRCEERAHWLADEHGLTHGYASAIVHEYEVRRRSRLNFA
jgi:hypothetical protein